MALIQFMDRGRYRKAFFACRKHRIDVNVIVDRNLGKFMNDISDFVDQVPEVDHINLFLTLIGYVVCLVSSSILYFNNFRVSGVATARPTQSRKSVMLSETNWKQEILLPTLIQFSPRML
jgi:hypothetical protein